MTTTALPHTGRVPCTVAVDAPVTKVRQGYGVDRVYALGAPGVDHRLRVQIDRNAYDEQSSYLVSLWTEEHGWVEVHRIAPEHPDMVALPSYVCFPMPARRQECIDAIEAVALRLLAAAEHVIYAR